jgi:hypothetical protein
MISNTCGDTLTRLDGKLYVLNTSQDSRDPVKTRLWWTVLRTEGWLPCAFLAGDPIVIPRLEAGAEGQRFHGYCRTCGQHQESPVHNTDTETYRLSGYDGRYGGRLPNGTSYTVHIDPRAAAIRIEHEPVPCPPVRRGLETRYRDGAWWKFLKSAGWVRLPEK